MEETENTVEKQRPAHLFKKGQSGNPAGRPVGAKNFTTKFREALNLVVEKQPDGKHDPELTYEKAFIRAILRKAIIDRDPATMRLVWNYLDGMPKQSVEMDAKISFDLTKLLDDIDGGAEQTADNTMEEVADEVRGSDVAPDTATDSTQP